MQVIDYVHIRNMFVHQDLKVSFKEGLNFIVGSVGAGKTLITESIAFCLFGSVALRGKSSTYDKKLEVDLAFSYAGEHFLIKRRLTDAVLFMKDGEEYVEMVNSTTAVNQKIISLLGYNYEIYLLSNYCKQKKLAYFSELTPSKRLQYIDKISGLEDAREYSAFLMSTRKSLKDQLSVLKDLIVPPVLPEGLDLEINYQDKISELNVELSKLNSFYEEYNKYISLSVVKQSKPVLNLNTVQIEILQLTDEQCSELEKAFEDLLLKNNEIQSLEKELSAIPVLPRQLSKLTSDEVDHHISQHNNLILKDLKDVNIICPSCTHSFELDSVLPSDSVRPNLSLSDLYKTKDYLTNNYSTKRIELERRVSVLEKEYGELLNSSKFLSSYLSFNKLKQERENLLNLSSTYQKDLEIYNSRVAEADSFKIKAEELKETIDLFIENQKQIVELKDQYTFFEVSKKLYLEQLEIFSNASLKFDEISCKVAILNSLIKDLNDISIKIKTDTLPLINYFASYYLNLMSDGSMTSLEVTSDYDLIVDGVDINLKSGGQIDLASLSWRLSLSKSVISGMLPLFIGDELDSSGGSDAIDNILAALETINNDFQVIIITHENISNVEHCNIINLNGVLPC